MTQEQLQQFKSFMETLIGKENHSHHVHIIRELFTWHNLLFPQAQERMSASSCGGCRARVYKKCKQQYDGLFPKEEIKPVEEPKNTTPEVKTENKLESFIKGGIEAVKCWMKENPVIVDKINKAASESSSENDSNTKDTPYINLLKDNHKVKK